MARQRTRRRLLVAALLAAASANGCSSDAATTTTPATPTPVTIAPPTTGAGSTTVASTRNTIAEPLAAHLAWVPPFVVAGSTVPVSIVLPDTGTGATIEVQIDGSPTSAAPASFDPDHGWWTAEVAVPDTIGPLTLTIVDQATGLAADPLTVPIVPGGGAITPTRSAVVAQRVVTLPFGDGDGQVGYSPAAGDNESAAPTAFTIDPRNGDLVVLDTVNHRVVVMSGASSTRVIELPGTGTASSFVSDIVMAGDRGVAVVDAFTIGKPEVTALLIDLDSGDVQAVGPVAIADNTPVNAPLVWNSADHTVYAAINNQYYSFVDVVLQQLLLDRPPITWLLAAIAENGTIALNVGTGHVDVAFEDAPGGLMDLTVADDGDIWLLNSTIGQPDSVGNTVQFVLVHIDPMARTAASVQVHLYDPFSGTRRLVVADDVAYLLDTTADATVIDGYALPTS